MTEAEWLASNDPEAMLRWLNHNNARVGKISDPDTSHLWTDRKLRLFACAALRLPVASRLADDYDKSAIEAAEAFADGAGKLPQPAEQVVLGRDAWIAAGWIATWFAIHEPSMGEKQLPIVAGLLRDIIGNPLAPIIPQTTPEPVDWPPPGRVFAEAWRTRRYCTPLKMAHRMYDARDFSDMPALGDALEEAGCHIQAVLNHCRGKRPVIVTDAASMSVGALDSGVDEELAYVPSGAPHVRGCWVIDLLTGRK